MTIHVDTMTPQQSSSDHRAVDRALAKLFAIREQLYEPDLLLEDDASNELIEREHCAIQTVALAKARTVDALMEKFGLLSSELARAPVSRPVRLLVASICSDVQDLLND